MQVYLIIEGHVYTVREHASHCHNMFVQVQMEDGQPQDMKYDEQWISHCADFWVYTVRLTERFMSIRDKGKLNLESGCQ